MTGPSPIAPEGSSAPRGVVRLLTVLLLAATFALAALSAWNNRIFDYDELWHLATGRVIVSTGVVPKVDPFSYTAGATPWVNTNWLAQAILYLLYRAGGIELDALLGLGLFLGAVALTHVQTRARTKAAWATLPVFYFVLVALASGSAMRPQGWTFLLLAAALAVMERMRTGVTRGSTLGLALVLGLSGQLHGGFVFVFGAALAVLAGELWDLRCRGEGASGRLARALATAIGLGLASFVLHPCGFAALAHPIRYAFDPRVREIFIVRELRPPDLTEPAGRLTELGVLSLLGLALVAPRRFRTSDVILVLGFAHLALTSMRGLHYFAIVVAAPLALGIESLLAAGRERLPPLVERLVATLDRLEPSAAAFARGAPIVLALTFVLAIGVRLREMAPGKPGDMSSPVLASAADVADIASYLAATDPPGRVWNEMETGGALIWRLFPEDHPEHKVWIDGRGDLYAIAGVWSRFLTVIAVDDGWEKVLREDGCDLALVTKGKPLEGALAAAGWRLVREASTQKPDRTLRLLVRPGSAAEKKLIGDGPR